MPFLPVAAREVREASRQARTYGWRCGVAGGTLGIMTFVGWVSRYDSSQSKYMFLAGATAAFIYCMLAGVVRTADTLAEEKRENTLGLLFLTDLKGWDIISGKLLSSSLNCFFGLVALMPILAIPMMMGGVSGSEFLRVLMGLLNALFIAISWGILVSTIFRHAAVTISLALLIAVFTAGIMPLGSVFLYEEYRLRIPAALLFMLSPLQGLVMALDMNRRSVMDFFWPSLLINHVLAWINLGLAVFFLPRFWQEAPKNKQTERWRDRLRAWRFGRGHVKTKLRAKLLNRNPLLWLSSRDRVGSGALMTVCALILILGVIGGTAAGRTVFRGPERIMVSWLFALAVVHAMVAVRMAMAASSRLADDRRSGALELLLGTEVSVEEILRGHLLGLIRQFMGPIAIVIFASLFGLVLILLSMAREFDTSTIFETLSRMYQRKREHAADGELFWLFIIACTIMAMLCVKWIGYAWVGMWLGLRERRSGFATWTTLGLVVAPPWSLFIIGMATAADARVFQRVSFEDGIPVVLSIAWMLGLGHVALLSTWAHRNLIRRFREAAADRFMVTGRWTWARIRTLALRFAIVAVSVISIFAITCLILNRRGEAAWKAALASHPKFTLTKPQSTAPKIPDAENLARAPMLLPLTTGARVPWSITWNLSGAMTMNFGGEPQWDWALSHRRDFQTLEDDFLARKAIAKTNVKSSPAETIFTALRVYDAKLAELQDEANARPRADFGKVANPMNSRFVYYVNNRAALRSLVDTLALRASAKIAMGIPALDDIFLAARLPEGLHDADSFHEAHFMALDLVQPVYDGLSARVWNAAELQRLQEKFAAFDFWQPYDAWREEYVWDAFTQLDAIALRRQGKRRSDGPSDLIFPSGLIRSQEAELMKWGYDDLPQAIDKQNRHIDLAKLNALRTKRPDRVRNGPDELTWTINTLGLVQTSFDQIVIACALERFRIEHGNLPRAVDELIPKYLAAIPHDVFTGKPLIVRINADRQTYRMVGVGPDGVENDGKMPLPNSWMLYQELRGYDFVWDSDAKDPSSARRNRKR